MYMNTAEEKVSQKIYNNTKYFGLNYKTMYYLYEKHQKFIKKNSKEALNKDIVWFQRVKYINRKVLFFLKLIPSQF